MSPCFADTFYFLALRNPRDEAHVRAVTATKALAGRPLVTTAWVLTEVADALADRLQRLEAVARLGGVKTDALPGAMVNGDEDVDLPRLGGHR